MADAPLDLNDFAPKTAAGAPLDLAAFAPPRQPSSAIGEIATAVKRGAIVDLPQLAGQALQYVTPEGSAVNRFGAGVSASAKARGMVAANQLHPEEHNVVTNALASGAEMLPSIAAPALLATGALASLPVTLPTAVGGALVAGATALPFAAQSGQETLDKAKENHVPEDQAATAARLNAGITLATQFGANLVGGKLLGVFGKSIFGDVVRNEGADIAKQTLAELTGQAGILKPFAKATGAAAVEASAVGAAQAGGTAAVNKAYGIDNEDPMKAAVEQIPAMLGLTAALAPFGLAARAMKVNSLAQRATALESKDTAPQMRDALATAYFHELNKVDPEAAKQFAINADTAIANKLPLKVDSGIFQEGAVKAPEPVVTPQSDVERLVAAAKQKAEGLSLVTPEQEAAARVASGQGLDPTEFLRQRALDRAAPVEKAISEQDELHQLAVTGGVPPGLVKSLPRTPVAIPAEESGPSVADFHANELDIARAREENRRAMADTHTQVVQELTNAGIEPTRALPFADFKDAMQAEAKKAGMKPSDITPDEYRSMWEQHQQDVMHDNFGKAQEHAIRSAAENAPRLPTSAGEKPKSALATALQDAALRKTREDAFAAHEREAADLKQRQLDAIQNHEHADRLATAAERGQVPAGLKTVPATAERVVQTLRQVKVPEQGMPPKLIKEVTGAVSGAKSLEEQLASLRALRESKSPNTASHELVDKLYKELGGDDAVRVEGTARVDVREPPSDGKAVGGADTKGSRAPGASELAAAAKEQGKGRGEGVGRTPGTTDDRHTIGPPNEVGELLPYTRTLSQAREGAGGIFGEKQWWQDLAWAVRHPETKIGKELLANGKVTDEQVSQALARDERYQKSDALLEAMRQKREERLRAQLLADAQPEGAKEVLKAKDLVNIFGGEASDYTVGRQAAPGESQAVRNILTRAPVQRIADVLDGLQHVATDPAHKRLIEDLKKLGLKTAVSYADRDLSGNRVGLYNQIADHALIGRGGATVETVLHELVHAATLHVIDGAESMLMSIEDGKLRESKLTPEARRQVNAYRELTNAFLDAMEKQGAEDHYGMEDPREFVAEALTNARFQKFLDSRSLWEKFVDAIKGLLGLKTPDTLLDRALRSSRDLMAPSGRSRELPTASELPSLQRFLEGPTSAAKQTDQVMEKISKLGDVKLGIKQGFTRAHLFATTLNHIAQVFKDTLPKEFRGSLDEIVRAKDSTRATVDAINRSALEASRLMSSLGEKASGLDTKLYRLQGEATRHGIFPDREIKDQPWAAKKADPQQLRRFNELRQIYKSDPDLARAYDAAARQMREDGEREQATIVRNLAYYGGVDEKHWKGVDPTKGFTPELKALEHHVLTAGTPEQRDALRGAQAMYQQKTQGPYFHLGRNGSYFTRFTVKDTPQARAAYERELGVSSLSTDRVVAPEDRHVFARYEQIGEWKAVSDKLEKLMREGHLEPGEMQSGELEKMVSKLDSTSPNFIRGLMRNIDTDIKLDDGQKAEAKDMLRRLWVEMLPETSASKAFAQRKGVAGYDVDMNRSFVKRSAASAFFVAHNSIRPEIEAALLKMKQGVSALQDGNSPHFDSARGLVGSALFNEIKARQANEMTPVRTKALDMVSALSHSFYLAANPAFFMMKTLQPWQLALPQLGARHGFVASFKAMAHSTAMALSIIKDTIGDGWQKDGWHGVLDPNVVIDRVKGNENERKFLRELVASGGVTFTQAHDMGRIAAGDSQGVSTAVKAANASLHYSEALDRMTAGIAGFNLEFKRTGDFDKATQYGIQVVKNSLYDYNTHNRGRAFTKQGIFGPATPLFTQFAQYQIQTLELLGRLTSDAFGKVRPGMTSVEREAMAQQQTEARKALAGVMATTLVLAGTMGLPGVAIIAAAYNKLFGTKDQPADALGDYRNFLADTFGKNAGEIIAHGSLRAAGTDLGASHLGFQDIVPFSGFLADRRKLQDRFDSGALSMMGPAVGAASGFAAGLQNMLQGRYMKGLEEMLPSGLKGVAKAIDLEQNGLTDLRGNKLPVDVNGWDIFGQAMNATPAKVAEQREAQFSSNTTAMLLKQRSSDLREQFAVATERGDAAAMQSLGAEITQFNSANPLYAIRDLRSALVERARERAVADVSGVMGHARQLPMLTQDNRFANVQNRGMP